jgi:methylase of polypeptide subunit release factors
MTLGNIFAQASDAYAAARPFYPRALFDWIADTCRNREAAWDCATGSGQAATALATIFDRVEATDVSAAQVAEAFAAPNIRYSV